MRGRLLASSCEACVQACPAEAITLAADDPELNPDLCSLCGGCVAACPEHVFALELPALRWADGKARFSPCPDHALSQAPLYLAPVQSLGMGELAVLWLQGVRDLEVAPGRCDDHLTPPLQEVAGRIKRFNALARARGLPGFTLSRATPAQARAWRDQADQPEDGRKRALLHQLGVTDAAPAPDARAALAEFLAHNGGEVDGRASVPYAYSPVIDAARCTGCDDCVNVCPHNALTVIKVEDDGLVYRAVPERCTGCRLCVDLCGEMAIDVLEMTEKSADIELIAYQCRGCGVAARTTLPAPPADGLCRICHQTGHHKKLFVVLD